MPRKVDWGTRRDLEAILAKLTTLTDDEALCILTFLTAECLPVASALVETLGAEMDVSLREDWKPDETFFALLRDKGAINGMVAEIAGTDIAAQHLTSTAKVQREVIKACLDGTRSAKTDQWLPRYMSFPMGGYTKQPNLGRAHTCVAPLSAAKI